MKTFTNWRKPKPIKLLTREIKPTVRGESGVLARQEEVPYFDQNAIEKLSVGAIGAGGIMGEIGEGLMRKGIKKITIYDDDTVELSNLNRQKFYRGDLYKNKALCLAKNLSREATKESVIVGIPFTFQEAVRREIDVRCDVAICGVDNNRTRVYVASYFLTTIPVVFIAVSDDTNNGYVFIQEPGKACFCCVFPNTINDKYEPCPGVPAVKDILKVVGGVTLYGIDTLIMDRKRDWNYREIFLAGFVPDRNLWIPKRPDCPVCGVKSDSSQRIKKPQRREDK